MVFKILSPAPYPSHDIYSGNIDINLVADDGNVYFATLFTISNLQRLMQKEEHCHYFWATDMVIVKDLRMESIRNAIIKIIEDGYLESAFSRIGDIKKIYGANSSFENVTPASKTGLLEVIEL